MVTNVLSFYKRLEGQSQRCLTTERFKCPHGRPAGDRGHGGNGQWEAGHHQIPNLRARQWGRRASERRSTKSRRRCFGFLGSRGARGPLSEAFSTPGCTRLSADGSRLELGGACVWGPLHCSFLYLCRISKIEISEPDRKANTAKEQAMVSVRR